MNKLRSLEELASQIPDGATVAIGGSSLSRKPMALVRALARTGVRGLRLIVDVGGPEVDLLMGVGAVSEVIYAFVGFEFLGLAPHFRAARQRGQIRFQEWSEYTVMAGLDAAIKHVPFMPTRAGLATDLLEVNHAFRQISDPFGGPDLVAVPALVPDFSLIHANYADAAGNALILGDGHIDNLCAKAARTTLVTAESVVPTTTLQQIGYGTHILRIYVNGVAQARWGAHPTQAAPTYRLDLEALKDYLYHAADPGRWKAYQETRMGQNEALYQEFHGGETALQERLQIVSPEQESR